MKKTPRVSPGQGVRAEHINAISEAILELQNSLVLSKYRPPPQSWDTKPNLWVSTPFNEVASPETPVWKVTVSPGYLTYQQLLNDPETDGSLYYMTPTINDIEIDVQPPADIPKVEISQPTGYLYMKSETDNRGVPTDAPTIVFETEKKKSTHHVPESVDYNQSPIDGVYYWLLAEFEEAEGSSPPAPKIIRRWTGDKHVPNQIDRIDNIGGEIPIYWGFDKEDSIHKLRSLKNATDTSEGVVPLIMELDTDADETVNIRMLANATPSTYKTEALVKDLFNVADDSVKIKAIKSGNGLDVTATDTVVEVKIRDGYQGDMLYNDGTDWVILSNPGSGTHVLGHNGTIPVWLQTSECD